MKRRKTGLKRQDTGGEGTFRPQLTSLIDVMTILLVFLMKSFSAEGNLVTPAADMELPLSSAKKTPRAVTTVEITRNGVMAGGEVIVPMDGVAAAGEEMVMPRLLSWMEGQKARMAATRDSYEVMIQSDKEIAFEVVKKVMFTCSKAGFADFSILVMEEV